MCIWIRQQWYCMPLKNIKKWCTRYDAMRVLRQETLTHVVLLYAQGRTFSYHPAGIDSPLINLAYRWAVVATDELTRAQFPTRYALIISSIRMAIKRTISRRVCITYRRSLYDDRYGRTGISTILHIGSGKKKK